MLNRIRKMLKQQEGFTLVELMIVVVILGIISGIGIQQYGKVQRRAQVSAHNANVRIIKSAANMYVMMENHYPTDEMAGEGKKAIDLLVDKGYMEEIPKNPLGGGDDVNNGTGVGDYKLTVTPPSETNNFYQIKVEPEALDE